MSETITANGFEDPDWRMRKLEKFRQGQRRLDAALLKLFSNEEIFVNYVSPRLGKDLKDCEDNLRSFGKLGFREFLDLTPDYKDLIALGRWTARGVQRLWNRVTS